MCVCVCVCACMREWFISSPYISLVNLVRVRFRYYIGNLREYISDCHIWKAIPRKIH